MTYRIISKSIENNGRKTFEETVLCNDEKELEKELCEILDLFKDMETGVPCEPDPIKIYENLGKFTTDKEFIDGEIEREKNAWKIFSRIKAELIEKNHSPNVSMTANPRDNWTVIVEPLLNEKF